MENDASAPEPGADISDIVQVPAAADKPTSLRDAARAVASFREKQRNPEAQDPQATAEEPAREPAAQQSGDEPDAAPQDDPAVRSETESADPAVEPPIEPPRSWTREDKELFKGLPRETQERLVERERSRESDFLRRQNEATERGKALEAERGKVEQARTQYEAALPVMLAQLQQQVVGDFSDVKTMADVERLAREDWPRYVLWDASQKKVAHVQQQADAANRRQSEERHQKLGEFIARESELFAEKAPEISDPAQRSKLQDAAVGTLKDLGFSDAELSQMWRGEKDLSIHDHRLQLLIRDGIRFRSGQAAVKNAAIRPVPPVQRPGTAQPRGAAQAQVVQNLTQRLDKTGSLKDAARLLSERRKASR